MIYLKIRNSNYIIMSDILTKFIKDYETDLTQISITERKNNGLGIMLMYILENEMK